jgi:hypothetical protein
MFYQSASPKGKGGSFPGNKSAGTKPKSDHSPPSSTEVKNFLRYTYVGGVAVVA